MATVREIVGQDASLDRNNVGRAIRTFYVDLAPDNIPADGSLSGLPGNFDAHPTLGGLIVDSVNARAVANGKHSEVTVLYSTNGAGRFSDVQRQSDIGFDTWSDDLTQSFDIKVPFLVDITVRVADGMGGTVEDTESQKREFTFEEPRRVVQKLVSTAMWSTSEANAVASQFNKLHLIGTQIYRYRGARAKPQGSRIAVTHSWVQEVGTLYPTINAPDTQATNVFFYRYDYDPMTALATPEDLGAYLRPPYHQVRIVEPAPGSAAFTPIIVPESFLIPNGWQSLPGVV